MDTKVLYSIALVIASTVAGFYYYSGKSQKLEVRANQDLSSNAENIQIIQTNDTGQLYAKANIQHMTQWMNNGRAELKQVQGIMYQNGQPNTTFHSDKTIADNDYRHMELTGNVTITRLNAEQQPSIRFKTDYLQGDTKTNQIQTDRLVLVTNPQAQFTSQGLKANLTTGQYEFSNIRGKYDPISQ